jgi:hypothetical protein
MRLHLDGPSEENVFKKIFLSSVKKEHFPVQAGIQLVHMQ